ncbi:MAG: phage holin family protein [Anaerolineales bacterium]|nr:phage holin family protein [Anaerolineales bacterium]
MDKIPTEKQDTVELNLPEIEEQKSSTGLKIGLILGALILLGLLITGLVFLLQPGTDTARVRDIFIIFLTLEFFVIGLALILLIIQVARLSHLLQNEVQPILESTRETAQTLKGTTAFLSDHLVEPVIKLNEYLAGLGKMVNFVRPQKKK